MERNVAIMRVVGFFKVGRDLERQEESNLMELIRRLSCAFDETTETLPRHQRLLTQNSAHSSCQRLPLLPEEPRCPPAQRPDSPSNINPRPPLQTYPKRRVGVLIRRRDESVSR